MSVIQHETTMSTVKSHLSPGPGNDAADVSAASEGQLHNRVNNKKNNECSAIGGLLLF